MKDKKEIDAFIFKISAIVRDNFFDVDVVMKKARKEVYGLLKAQRQELKKWLLANNCCPLSDDVVIEKKKVINLLEERKE